MFAGIKRIAGAGILFDAIPVAAGSLGGGDDFLEVEIAVADFAEANF
ncbi:MAG: hypothetical protein WCS70_09525 [Verrucomicrobiota bacterium]